ncbi:hypothetical protein [Absidia glauca]|uniref:LysM domain-containing protein n=1 Tax=Absidia glauca TaxID=4829 RepID=A0A168RZ61_ABSGL|nr:hypothetical protein [Absidia glauca]
MENSRDDYLLFFPIPRHSFLPPIIMKHLPFLFVFALFLSVVTAITCTKKHKVYGGETCIGISDAAHITLANFYKWNPSLKKSKCTTLHVGQYVCLSAPLTTTSSKKATSTTKAATTTKPATTTTKPATTTTTKPTTTTTKKPTTTTKKPTTTASSTPTGIPGLTTAVLDEARFCLFLPPTPGNKGNYGGMIDPDAIADSEKTSRVFCTLDGLVPGARLMPDGFITSAHYQFNTTAGFVQVTGEIDRTKYSLSAADGGGQYDNHGAGSPPLSMCQGYKYYVSLIEPDIQGYCIRCCETYQDCNASRSAYGCRRVVPPLAFSV